MTSQRENVLVFRIFLLSNLITLKSLFHLTVSIFPSSLPSSLVVDLSPFLAVSFLMISAMVQKSFR